MKSVRSLLGRSVAALAIGIAAAAPAKAEVVGFYYGTDLVARLTTSGDTTFSLEFLYAPAASGVAFVNDILLGYSGSLSGASFSNLSGDTAPNAVGCITGPGCAAEGTGADWKVSWPTAGSGDRFNEGETSRFSISTSDPARWDFSRLHINAFLSGDSIKLTGSACTTRDCRPPTTVSEPGTLALVSLALIGAGVATRRRRPK